MTSDIDSKMSKNECVKINLGNLKKVRGGLGSRPTKVLEGREKKHLRLEACSSCCLGYLMYYLRC